jgi:hypothetical protein
MPESYVSAINFLSFWTVIWFLKRLIEFPAAPVDWGDLIARQNIRDVLFALGSWLSVTLLSSSPYCLLLSSEGYGLQSLRENWKTVRFVVEAPAFMRGKERFSAPGKSRDFDHAL